MWSAVCRQNAQCASAKARSGPWGADGAEELGKEEGVGSAVTQRSPCAVQTAKPWRAWPCHSACDTVGANAANTATSSAKPTAQGRWIKVRRARDGACVVMVNRADYLCSPWCMGIGMAAGPPGGVMATGTLSSVLVSTPLASLNTSVMGMVLSLASGCFKSINITW